MQYEYAAHIPGGVGAVYPIITEDGNAYATTEAEARAGLRSWLKVRRLPAGTEIWRKERGA